MLTRRVGTARDGVKFCNEHYLPLTQDDQEFDWIWTCEKCTYPLEE